MGPFSSLEFVIALRYLRSRRNEGFISVITLFSLISIMLGVGVLIVVMSVMNGFRSEITSKILGFNGHVMVSSYARDLKDYDSLAKKIEEIDLVEKAIAVIDGQAMVVSKHGTTGAIVKSLTLDDLRSKRAISGNIISGSLDGFADKNSIMLGRHMAFNLGVDIGDYITLVSPQTQSTAIGTMPRLKKYRVVATFESGMYEYDNNAALIPLQAAQLFFRYPDAVSSIEIFTKDPDMALEVVQEIAEMTNELYHIRSWQSVNASLFNALKVEKSAMFFILSMVVLIASFNIVSSLVMLVNDKSGEIAILRTMGASRSMIMRVFLICGCIIGVCGTVLGCVGGMLFSINIAAIKRAIESITGSQLFDPMVYFLAELPSKLAMQDVVLAMLVGLISAFVATIYPALKASRKSPAEALRYE